MEKLLAALADLGVSSIGSDTTVNVGDDNVVARLIASGSRWTLRIEGKAGKPALTPTIKTLVKAAMDDGAKPSWATTNLLCLTHD